MAWCTFSTITENLSSELRCFVLSFRQRFHETGSKLKPDILSTDRPRVSTGLVGTVPLGVANRG